MKMKQTLHNIAVKNKVITRKNSKKTFPASEENFKQLFNSAHIAQWIYDSDSLQVLCANNAALEQYGYSEEEFLNMTIMEIAPDEELQKLILYNEFIKTTDKSFSVVNAHRKKNGERISVECTSVNIGYNGLPCILVNSIDITQKIKLEEKIGLQRVMRQQKITQATINGQEREREDIGKELHDNVNQLLTSVKLYLEVARSNENLRVEFIGRSETVLEKAINEIRSISYSLLPPTLKDIGFKDSLSELFETYLVTESFKINLVFEKEMDDVDPEIQITLFRIIQEHLNNILKHAQAQNVTISLAVKEQISLLIKDDGNGFDTKIQSKGSGIANMKNRVELYNGKVNILSKPGQGCTLSINIPAINNNAGKHLTNILIVEDDLEDQEIMTRVFSEIAPHCNITCLNDGKILVDLLQSFSDKQLPSLIVLDYNMPLLNGLETLRALELDKRFSKIPKVIYTSSSLADNKNLCYSANAKAYITKGITMDEIRENVHEMLTFVGSNR